MKKNEQWQLAVVGAGASGLIAAVRAAQEMKKAGRPVSVLVLEGSAKPGRKLLATGNGKCNFTNKDWQASYFRGSDFSLAEPVLRSFSLEDTLGPATE